jgi:DNA mismatch repair ATPase MutS
MHADAIILFSEFDQFYQEYLPLTPYGLANKNKYLVSSDLTYLQITYNSIEKVVTFIQENPLEADKIESNLHNISFIDNLGKTTFDTTDIFLIKKFLICFKAITIQLNEEVRNDLKIDFSLQELLNLLMPEDNTNFGFYIDSSYEKKLKSVRNEINTLDNQISEVKGKRLKEIIDLYNLDFNFCDFLIVDELNASRFSNELIYKEIYDSTSLRIKPIFPPRFFELYQQKDLFLKEEHALEQKVISYISEAILKKKDLIEENIKITETLDTLFAKARLVLKYSMVKPQINDATGCIGIQNGRFLPLVDKCKKMGSTYSPLTASFDNKIIVVTGSNMGGKTVLLKTIGFFQLLTQMGFWVPADFYTTSLFEKLSYIGNEENLEIAGLSSFGFEIHKLTEIFKGQDKSTLLLIDELAKTTNSIEAQSLISALLMSFSQKEFLYCFLSTHFMELPSFKAVSFYKMKGFSHAEYQKLYIKNQQLSLNERIRLINSFMQYEVVKEDNVDKSYDAITIADILGLDEEIVRFAKNYLKEKYD